MTYRKTVSALTALSMLALAACSSTLGDGSPAPSRTTVVVPPASSVTTTE